MTDGVLKSLMTKISGVLKSDASGSVVGIDIGASSIKVVQIKKENGKAVLETYGSISTAPYAEGVVGQVVSVTEEALVKALNDLFKEANVTTKNSALSIPASSSLVFLVELPGTVSEKDVGELIYNESRRYIPVPITEVAIDWWLVPKRPLDDVTDDSMKPTEDQMKNEKTKVLVAAIHNEALDKYKSLVNDAKIDTDFFEIEMFSSVRSLTGQDLGTNLIFDLGASKTKISIVDRGVIQDFHIINRGSHDITTALVTGLNIPFQDAEAMKKEFGLLENPKQPKAHELIKGALDYIFFEAEHVVLNYEKKYNKSVGKIVLSGGGVLLKGVEQSAREKFNTEVILGNPFSRIDAPAFLSNILAESAPEFAVACGLALRKLLK
jgi:type IV pilus assembly protein PilM